jgi:hypothetical protein
MSSMLHLFHFDESKTSLPHLWKCFLCKLQQLQTCSQWTFEAGLLNLPLFDTDHPLTLPQACTDCYTKVMNGFTSEPPTNYKTPESRASISFTPSQSLTSPTEPRDSHFDDVKPRSNSLTSTNSDPDTPKSSHLKWVEAILLVKKDESGSCLEAISPEKEKVLSPFLILYL